MNSATLEHPRGPSIWLNERPWIDDESIDIDAHVDRHHAGLPLSVREALHQWRRDGYVVFRQVIPLDLIEALNRDLVHLQDHFKDYTVPVEIRGQQLSSSDLDKFPAEMAGVKINQFHCFSRAAALLGVNDAIAQFLAVIFQGPASVCQSLTFWKGSEQAVHIDYPYVRQQARLSYLAASWIPLEDVDPKSGPLAYYPGGHKIDKSGFFDWGDGSILYDEASTRNPVEFGHYLAQRMQQQAIEPVVFCPRMGDVLIWHGNLPHEGTAVQDPTLTRKSLVTHYTSEADLPAWMRNFAADGSPAGVFTPLAKSYRYPWFDSVPRLRTWEPDHD